MIIESSEEANQSPPMNVIQNEKPWPWRDLDIPEGAAKQDNKQEKHQAIDNCKFVFIVLVHQKNNLT